VTVRRQASAVFDASPAVVAKAVRSVLSQRPPYVRTDEVEADAVFSTNVRPSWWLTGTEMKVDLEPFTSGTQVFVETTSQFYVMGDVFGYYDGYIQSFLSDVRKELRSQ
jgi:hypothetical protein